MNLVGLPLAGLAGPTLPTPPPSLTYDRTAKRSYEKAYWQTYRKALDRPIHEQGQRRLRAR